MQGRVVVCAATEFDVPSIVPGAMSETTNTAAMETVGAESGTQQSILHVETVVESAKRSKNDKVCQPWDCK
jgi:hypothetical protein